jgi:glycosyltransferase involved in cell wall biosynthesis
MKVDGVCIAYGMDISEPCGATHRVLAFAQALQRAGYDVKIVIPKPRKELPKHLNLENIELINVPLDANTNRIIRGFAIAHKAKKLAKANKYMLQVEFSHFAGIAALIGCSGYLLDMHDLAFASPTYDKAIIRNFCRYLERKGISECKKVIVVSTNMKRFLSEEWRVPEEVVEVIPNGYFTSKIETLALEVIREKKGTVSFMGTLAPYLDLDKIISLSKSLRTSVIYVVGDGPMRSKLEKSIKRNKINNIILSGRLPLEKALKVIAKSQVAIYPASPSLHEEVSCPVKILEYAALGKAIVASSKSEICKILKENEAALVSDTNDRQEFIEGVHKLLEDDKLRKKLGENAKRVVRDYSWERQGKKLIKIYEELT